MKIEVNLYEYSAIVSGLQSLLRNDKQLTKQMQELIENLLININNRITEDEENR